MHKIVIYCKTYSGDLNRVKVLIDSVKKFNKDRIPFYISIPKREEQLFKDNVDTDYVNIVFDEDVFDMSVQNWYTQQVIKSSFWKLNLCENYVMVDSDSYFIRDFYIPDFMYDSTTPYTVMHEQKNLFEWSSRFEESIGHDPQHAFKEERLKIMKMMKREGRFFDFGPGPVIWSCKVWEKLYETQLKPQNLDIVDLINIVPSEFTWYGEFLLKTRVIDIIPVEPIFKFFHFSSQYIYYKQLKYTEEILSKNYMGIVMQSNFNAPYKF
jgi:hypothetical protein